MSSQTSVTPPSPAPATTMGAAALPATGPPPRRWPEVLAALRISSPVGLGFLPLGLAFGIYLTHAGLPWWSATVLPLGIFAGSFEFLLAGMVLASTPLVSIALSALLVNVRHSFYALSFPLHRLGSPLAKAYGTFALCDEAYALTAVPQARSWSGTRILSVQAFLHLYWVGSSTLGALLGNLVPDGVTGLDFALTALFTVLALDAVRERRHDLPTPVLALICALTARVLFPEQMLLTAFGLFTAALLAQYLLTGRRTAHV